MKKLFIATLLVATTAIAHAQFTGETEHSKEDVKLISPFVISSVSDVRQMPDDTYVTVQGNIVQQQGHDKEKYLFRDTTGEIIVEIDRKLWKGQQVAPETEVKILGELDQSRNPERVKIDAVYIEALQ